MFVEIFFIGIFIGITASIPLGPIGVICIQRTLNRGRLAGYVSGAGAALADGLFAIIAGYSISFIIDSIIEYQILLKILGGIILIFWGIKLLISNTALKLRKQMQKNAKGLLGDFLSVFVLTVSNPIGIFVFGVIFATFNLVESNSNFSIFFLVLGVIIGANIWWFSLTSTVNIFRHKFKLRKLLLVNQIAGLLVLLFGLFVFISLFY